ncbi:MAG TPA: PQQ-binding-like beta-propeller repeat protein [Blastocatellia bacterium]|nr:PQQ-binding-like beta-propeller repeat protein [Blastocatellia bacterium]
MESTSTSMPWYKSSAAIGIATILFPPLGLILLWTRGDMETGKKVFGSVAIVALSVSYIFIIFFSGLFGSGGMFFAKPDPRMEAHYDELERQRAQQREALASSSVSASTPDQPTAGAASNANASQPAAVPGAAASRSTRTYWTDYRGPSRDGRYDEVPIRTEWPAGGPRLLWKQPIGGGYASFVIAEGVAFTIEQRRRQEVVAAYDLETGRELWTQASDAEFVESMGGDGPRATPTWEAGRLYALGAVGDLRCLDAKTGKVNWTKNILKDAGAENLQWGMAGAPLIVDDKVVVLPGGRSGKSIVAYNKMTGAQAWKSLNDTQAYVSPMLVTLAGQKQILVVTSNRVVGLAPSDGALLWESSWNTDMGINCSQPIVIDGNRFFISSGYGKGAALVEITSSGDGMSARKVWENTSMKNKFNSSVLFEGNVYGLDEGILTCVDVKTGERKWKGGRYGYGQLILASGHLIIISDTGELALVKATPEKHAEVAKFPALEGKTWNYPAIADGRLLVRNQTQMACFDLSGK